MEQKSYFQQVFKRGSLKLALYALFYRICSTPRLIIEVFIRKNMGSRYFSFGSALFLFLISLAFLVLAIIAPTGSPASIKYGGIVVGIFGFAFLYFANQRHKESKLDSFSVNFEKFSLSTGELTGWFKSKLDGGASIQKIEILYEPLPFFLIGLVLSIIPLTLPLGIILLISSIVYSLSYLGAYAISRDVMMDRIDEKICGEEMGEALKEGFKNHEGRGFRNRSPIPSKEADRMYLYEELFLKQDKSGEPTSVAQ